MGIKGLHKALSFCTVKDNLRNHRNAIVAVDASSWMHKSVYSVSEKFVEATDSNRLDEGCVRVSARYIIARCKELIEIFRMKAVYLVIDGKRIPLKADETLDRDQKRRQNLTEARRLKNSGQRWKAEDKYKSCIRIKDDFTKSVMMEVKKAFSAYGRVHFVNSPHEADSQLTRLVLDGVADVVVTEDSDVLVYSAAAHVAFPILFKLDRKTGDCDSIKMDWLLSLAASEEETKPVTSGNTLEGILRRLASRQAKKRGFGVRLFVQGCILAGCDYRKNIEGIGTTNAFKLVRDNAFRDDSIRFRKILESLPKKVRQKIDINEYEEILAKSEAIFFYHPVLHTDGTVKPLLTPRISEDDDHNDNYNDGKNHITHHYPCMSRFQGDWSFLGSMSLESGNNDHDEICKQLGPTIRLDNSSLVLGNKRDSSHISSPSQSRVIQNPYKKSKTASISLREAKFNTQPSIGHDMTSKRTLNIRKHGSGGIERFLVKPNPKDVRPFISTKGSRDLSLSGTGLKSLRSFASKKSSSESFFLRISTEKQTDSISTKYPGVEPTTFDDNPKIETKADETPFLYTSLNGSNSAQHAVIEDNEAENIAPNTAGHNSKRHEIYDLTLSDSSEIDEHPLDFEGTHAGKETTVQTKMKAIPPSANAQIVDTATSPRGSREIEQNEIVTSRFFARKNSSRRVTLDSFTNPTPFVTADVGSESSTHTKFTNGHAMRKRIRGLGEPFRRLNVLSTRRSESSSCIDRKSRTEPNVSDGSLAKKIAFQTKGGTLCRTRGRFSNTSVSSFFSPRKTSKDKK